MEKMSKMEKSDMKRIRNDRNGKGEEKLASKAILHYFEEKYE